MSHFILKLTTGEFVYGVIDLDNTDKNMVTLENPLTWEDYETSDGGHGSALVKYCVGTKDKQIPISSASIISMVAMSTQFSSFYDAAVEVNKITDEAYDEKLLSMTKRMQGMVLDFKAKFIADETGGLVAYSTDSDTIH